MCTRAICSRLVSKPPAELALLNDIQSFLMDMGRSIALVGRQFPLKIVDEETGEDQATNMAVGFWSAGRWETPVSTRA